MTPIKKNTMIIVIIIQAYSKIEVRLNKIGKKAEIFKHRRDSIGRNAEMLDQ